MKLLFWRARVRLGGLKIDSRVALRKSNAVLELQIGRISKRCKLWLPLAL